MAAYSSMSAGNSIGSLLRMIQEQKSQGPIVRAENEAGSPMRNMLQTPLKAPESPETERVVSLKPEGTQPEGVVKPVMPMRASVGPVSIGGTDVGKPVSSPVASSPGQSVVTPQAPQVQPRGEVLGTSRATPTPLGQAITQLGSVGGQISGNRLALEGVGTKIKQAETSYKQAKQTAQSVSQRTPNNLVSRVIATVLRPTPTPAPKPQSKYAPTIRINGRTMTYDPRTNTYRR